MKYKGTYIYIDVNKKKNQNLKYGDYISVQGIYEKVEKPSNYGGFDYAQYLKQEKVYRNSKK